LPGKDLEKEKKWRFDKNTMRRKGEKNHPARNPTILGLRTGCLPSIDRLEICPTLRPIYLSYLDLVGENLYSPRL
jgi:hypothetical protein